MDRLETAHVAGDEAVTSPDQHRPTASKRLSRLGAVVTILALLAMAWAAHLQPHQGHISDIFLIGTAGLIFLLLVLDVILRKAGLRSE